MGVGFLAPRTGGANLFDPQACRGVAGARETLEQGVEVVGLDNLNAYYDPALKQARLAEIDRVASRTGTAFHFVKADVADKAAVDACFAAHGFDRVIHLAAQAGVRHSIEAPGEYVSSNLVGFANILEACRNAGTAHLVYASTSSIAAQIIRFSSMPQPNVPMN